MRRNAKPPAFCDALDPRLDLGPLDLLDGAAPQAHQMVMVRFAAQLEALLDAAGEAVEDTGLGERRQRSVDGGQARPRSGGAQTVMQLLRGDGVGETRHRLEDGKPLGRRAKPGHTKHGLGALGAHVVLQQKMKINFSIVGAMRRFAIGLALVIAAGCGASEGQTDGVVVVASFYPLAFVTQRVAGPDATVRDLTPAGAEPHDLEVTPRQLDALQRADLVVFLSGGFQPAISDALPSSGRRLDATSAAGPLRRVGRSVDPHFWLDPSRLALLADAVAERLGSIDPDDADAYKDRSAALKRELDRLDRSLEARLQSCRRREIVTSHDAFGYLAARYRLRQIPVSGIDPEAEPTAGQLRDVVAAVRRHRATTVFSETLLSPKIAQTVARETGVRIDTLDPVEGVRGNDTYFTVMRRNLNALRRALDCP